MDRQIKQEFIEIKQEIAEYEEEQAAFKAESVENSQSSNFQPQQPDNFGPGPSNYQPQQSTRLSTVTRKDPNYGKRNAFRQIFKNVLSVQVDQIQITIIEQNCHIHFYHKLQNRDFKSKIIRSSIEFTLEDIRVYDSNGKLGPIGLVIYMKDFDRAADFHQNLKNLGYTVIK